MSIVQNLKMDSDQRSHTFKLHVFAFTAINLGDVVSLFSRVSLSNEQVLSLQQFCSNWTKDFVIKNFSQDFLNNSSQEQ